MKCRLHPQEDGPGVCASCLRERLLDAREEGSPGAASPPQTQTEPQPLPVPCSPSASPLTCARPSEDSAASHLPLATAEAGPSSAGERRTGSAKVSFLSSLFGRHHQRSEEAKPKSMRSRHWIPVLVNNRWTKKTAPPLPADDRDTDTVTAARPRRSSQGQDRGSSPEPGDSASDTDSCRGWWRRSPSPWRRASADHHQHPGRRESGEHHHHHPGRPASADHQHRRRASAEHHRHRRVLSGCLTPLSRPTRSDGEQDQGKSPDPGDNAESAGGGWRPTPSPGRRASSEHHHWRMLASFSLCLSPLVRRAIPGHG